MPRPIQSWHGFVGQRKIVASLAEHSRGAQLKGETLPHIAFEGTSGTGKTHLANALADDMQTKCHDFYSSKQAKKWKLAQMMAAVKKGDILFIDEIHSLPSDCQELLYPALDRHEVPAVDPEKRRVVEGEWIQIPPFTLVVATDQPGLLRNALKQRIVLRYTLSRYGVAELRQIILNHAASLGILLKPQAATRLAEAARGIPRKARRTLESLRTSMVDLQVEVTKGMMDRYLNSIGIDKENLTETDIRYLKILLARKKHVSLRNLAIQLGTDVVAVQADVEGYLTQRGLIGIESGGRFLTPDGATFCAERGLQ